MELERCRNEELPDTYGLPEYLISDVVSEIDGPNVRMICGVRRGGHIHWLYSCVMRSDQLAATSQQLGNTAAEARGLAELMAGRGH
jgi:hypothetical protein